jgi:ligand-binding sensor domain-containing protein
VQKERIMKKIGFFLLIFLFFVGEGFAQRQNKWRNYLDAASLQSSEMVKSGDNLWLSTNGGLLRYNTTTGKHDVFQPDSCAMKGVKVTSVCSDSMGGVWFATNAFGLQHFDGTTFRWWPTKTSGEPFSWLRKIQLDKQGRLWMLNQTADVGASPKAEILVFQNGQFRSYAQDSIAFERDFAVDKDGVCWSIQEDYFPNQRTSVSAYDSRNGQITKFDFLNSPLKLAYGHVLLRTDNVGNVWTTYSSEIYPTKLFLQLVSLQNWRTYVFTNDRNVYNPSDFTFDNQGGMHIVNSDYYFTFRDSSWLQRSTGDYFYGRFLSIDATKSWALGATAGLINQSAHLIKIEGNSRQLMSFKSAKTLINQAERSYTIFGNDTRTTDLHCQTFDFDGRQFKPNKLTGSQGAFDGDSLLWLAGLNYISQFDFRTNMGQAITTQRVVSDKILVDKWANKWVYGGNYKGLFMLTPSRDLSFFNFSTNDLGTYVSDFAIDTAGNIWALSDSGLVKRNARTQTWAIVRLPDTLRNYRMHYINIDEGNHIWLVGDYGTCLEYSEQNGIKRLDYNQVSTPSRSNFENIFDRFVTYRNGVWWFATRYGLVRYDGVNYQRFDANNSPMATKNIRGIFTDKLGNIWLNHPYGLTVFNDNNLVDLVTSTKEIAQEATNIPHQFFPNPLSNQGILRFDNPQNQLFELQIFNANGQILRQQKTTSHQFLIDNKDFTQGIYFYVFKNEGKIGRGKFVVP